MPGAVLGASQLLSASPHPSCLGPSDCCPILQMRTLKLRAGTCLRSRGWTAADGCSHFGDTEGCPHPAPCAAHRDILGQCCPEGRWPWDQSCPACPSLVTSGPTGPSETPVSDLKTSLRLFHKHSERCIGKMTPLWIIIPHPVTGDTFAGLKQWLSSL